MADEEGYLVEKGVPGHMEGRYLGCLAQTFFWSTSNIDALRFARESDARNFLRTMKNYPVPCLTYPHEITGHIWMDAKRKERK